MPRFEHPNTKLMQSPPTDVSFARGWTVDILTLQNGAEQIIYRDCALTTLARASALFERLANEECHKPLAYAQETRIQYLLPRGIAGAAFLRILEWINAINEISAHGDIEDPQITTFDGDGLTQYLRLLQAANMLELKHPLHNQKRLLDIIKATIKKAFDTKNNYFKNVTITDREIGLIWDFGEGYRENTVVKLLLALFVDAYDIRKEFPNKYSDNVVQRFDVLLARNEDFRSAVIDVKTKKKTRVREEERERKGLPKPRYGQKAGQKRANPLRKAGKGNAKSKESKVGTWDDMTEWRDQELNEHQVDALMRRPEEFKISYDGRHGIQPVARTYGEDAEGSNQDW